MIEKVFVTSDLHFGHANIIKYCNRPFSSVFEMNGKLVANWNDVVGKNDCVFVIGDFAFSKSEYLMKYLNGFKILIKGNHDQTGLEKAVLNYKGTRFLLIHDPKYANGWNGWIIHGHCHNSAIKKYPLVHAGNRTINVSIEMTDYMPIDMDRILFLIQLIKEAGNEEN